MRQHRLRLLIVLAGVMLVVAACEDPRDGTVRFINDSDETILFINAGGQDATLQDAVERWSWNPPSLPPGGNLVLAFDVFEPEGRPGDNEPWCVNATYFIVRSKTGRVYSPKPADQDPPFEADDLEILEQLGPGHCWPERITEYRYTGN